MINVFKRELKANRASLLVWALGMLVMAAAGFGEYGVIMGSDTDISSVVDMMPRVVRVMLGMDGPSVNTPGGWYVAMYLYLALIAFIHAAMLGASVISKEERDKTSEFLFTRPVKRSAVITGKLIAAVLNSLALTLVAWGTTVAVWWSHIQGTELPGQLAATMFGMFITQMVFLFVGLCLSAIFSEKGKAGITAAVTVLATYFLSVFIEMLDIDFLSFLTPFRYFRAEGVMNDGLGWMYILLSTVICAVAGTLTYIFFNKRDLRS